MSNKGCELCGKAARMFCESDQASLCWDCDERVHSANFLVAKHCRTLLCHVCCSPTPWKAAGLNLGPAVSVCRSCSEQGLRRASERSQIEGENQGNDDSQESESDDGEFDSDSEYFGDGEIGEEEDGDNQVVPWSICGSAPPSPSPPAAASSSCSEDDASFSSLKRFRETPFESENEDGCCTSRNPETKIAPSDSNLEESDDFGSSSRSLFRPLKLRKTNVHTQLTLSEQLAADQNQGSLASGSAAVIDRLRRFRREMTPEGGVLPK